MVVAVVVVFDRKEANAGLRDGRLIEINRHKNQARNNGGKEKIHISIKFAILAVLY